MPMYPSITSGRKRGVDWNGHAVLTMTANKDLRSDCCSPPEKNPAVLIGQETGWTQSHSVRNVQKENDVPTEDRETVVQFIVGNYFNTWYVKSTITQM